MKYTTNFRFKKPEATDSVNINDLNDSFDLVDAELKKQKDNNDAMLVNETARVQAETNRALAEQNREDSEETRAQEHQEMVVEVDAIKQAYDNATKANLSVEVSNARGNYGTLKDRLNAGDTEVLAKASQTALDATNATVSQKANKSEVTNVMTPKGNIAYASLPMTGNTVGWYYYCPDGDGTNGKGNYVWNGTAWYFGGTGDQGYSIVKNDLDKSDDYTSNLIGSIVEENLYKGSAEWTGTWITGSIWQDTTEKIKGFKVKKKTGSWSGLFKLINVVAGKSYTFTAWVKVSVAQNISIMLTQLLSGYETTATVTGGKTYNIGANTWVKVTATFTCSVSGTVAPRVENQSTADFYVAGYKLVEGSTTFELSDLISDVTTLKNYDVAKIKLDVSNIAIPNINWLEMVTFTPNKVYIRGYQTVEDNVNASIYGLISIKAGQTYYYRMLYAYFCTIKYEDGTLVSLSNTTESNAYGSFTPTQNGTIAISVSPLRTGYIFTDSEEMYRKSIVNSYYVPNKLIVPKVYYVKKDGTGDFTSLVEAITEACKYMFSKVFVGDGIWDLIAELGSAYVESVSFSQRGLYLKNGVTVIFSSRALITCHYTGTRTDTITWLSAFNAGIYGFTLVNARIASSKCRYSVHDERDSDTDHYENNYIGCYMKHDNSAGGYSQCIGGGLGLDGHIVIDGCIFENPARSNTGIVSWHNSAGDGRSSIEVKGSYFKGTNGFRGSWYGQSTDISTFLVHGNSFGRAIEYRAETTDGTSPYVNTELIEFLNDVRP